MVYNGDPREFGCCCQQQKFHYCACQYYRPIKGEPYQPDEIKKRAKTNKEVIKELAKEISEKNPPMPGFDSLIKEFEKAKAEELKEEAVKTSSEAVQNIEKRLTRLEDRLAESIEELTATLKKLIQTK